MILEFLRADFSLPTFTS